MEPSNSEEQCMERAIAKAREGITQGQSPFGAVIVPGACWWLRPTIRSGATLDPTAHAEVNCIRSAARALQAIDLDGCEMYSTCEPCPMCLAAIHWSKINRVVFGATIADAAAAGFCELHLPPPSCWPDGQAARSRWKAGCCGRNVRRCLSSGVTGAVWNLLIEGPPSWVLTG